MLSKPLPANESPIVSVIRLLISAGGITYVAQRPEIPWWAVVSSYVVLGIPTHVGKVIDLILTLRK